MNKKNSALFQTTGLLAATIFFIFVLSFLFGFIFPQPRPGRMFFFFEEYLMFKAIISSVNTVLLVYLIYNYVSLYNEVKSKFSLGLIGIALALFAYSISDNPLFLLLFGLKGAGMGFFTVIPSVFTLIAVLVLIYLSRE